MIKLLRIFLLLTLLFPTTFVWADDKHTDANIIGHVIDADEKQHLPHVVIRVLGTTISTMTDGTGHYFFKNLPKDTITLEVRYTGFRTITRKVIIRKNETREVNFVMQPDDISLDEVVVSANRSETKRREAPNLVNVLDGKEFETTQSTCLAQGLNFQPGVRTEDDCQNCGFTQVRINGLDGHYSQILINSRPIFSALIGVYGLEQIPANMIERVEVVRGGGSALYGASAIGGTINVITKDPLHNSAEVGHTLMNIGGSSSFENVTTANASLVTDNRKAGIFLYGQIRNRDEYDHDGDGYTELPGMKNKTLGFNSFLRLSTNSRLTLEYHGINEFRRGGNLMEQPPHMANIAEQTEHDIHGGGLGYDFFSDNTKHHLNAYFSFQYTNRDSYYGGIGSGSPEEVEAANLAYGNTKDFTYVLGTQYVYKFDRCLFMPADLTAGIEYNFDGLDDVILGYNRNFNQDIHITSAFLQNEWKNKQWSFLIGGRLDKHNLIDNVIFSPRVNLRYNPTESVNLRASYAGGFRAPQAFDEDLHVGVVGGERLVTVLADNLKEERSHSFSLSSDMYFRFGNVQTNFLVEGFYTKLNNVFALRKLSGTDAQGNIVQERYNAYGAHVYGVNLEARASLTKWFQLQAGFTLQRSQYDREIVWNEDVPDQKTKRILRSPDAYGYFTASLTPVRNLTVALTGNYTGSMHIGHNAGSGTPVPEIVETPAFMTLNAKVTYEMPIVDSFRMQISGGVQNIANAYQNDFDQGWERDSDYMYGPSTPRSYHLGVKLIY